MRRFLLTFCLALAIWIHESDACAPPITLNLPPPTSIHGFLSETINIAVPFQSPIPFTGTSLVNGGMTSGSSSLIVPSAGNYLAIFSVVTAGGASNFGIAVNGSAVVGAIMDNAILLATGVPCSLSAILSLNGGDVVDVRNFSADGLSKLLATTDPAVTGSSSRAVLSLIKLSTP